MQQTQQESVGTQGKKPWFYILMGFLAGWVVMGCLATALILALVLVRPEGKTEKVNEIPDASVQITVASDGCAVERGDVVGESQVRNLTWVINDEQGFTVLERIAEDEYMYRYFQGGHFTVHLKAWYNGQYHAISNEVSIDC